MQCIAPHELSSTSSMSVSPRSLAAAFGHVPDPRRAASVAYASIGNRRKPTRLYVDRPFIFMVRDLKTDAILFFGRVASLTEQ